MSTKSFIEKLAEEYIKKYKTLNDSLYSAWQDPLWWENELSYTGVLAAAAWQAKAVAVQEFQVRKRVKIGRGDLAIKYGKTIYMIEAKKSNGKVFASKDIKTYGLYLWKNKLQKAISDINKHPISMSSRNERKLAVLYVAPKLRCKKSEVSYKYQEFCDWLKVWVKKHKADKKINKIICMSSTCNVKQGRVNSLRKETYVPGHAIIIAEIK